MESQSKLPNPDIYAGPFCASERERTHKAVFEVFVSGFPAFSFSSHDSDCVTLISTCAVMWVYTRDWGGLATRVTGNRGGWEG